MPFHARPGETFLLPHPGSSTEHLWVVVVQREARVLIVNFNTLRRGSDQTVVLDLEDHPFISRPTVVTYADARIVPQERLVELYQLGQTAIGSEQLLRPHSDCSPELLARITAGVQASKFTPLEVKEFCENLD